MQVQRSLCERWGPPEGVVDVVTVAARSREGGTKLAVNCKQRHQIQDESMRWRGRSHRYKHGQRSWHYYQTSSPNWTHRVRSKAQELHQLSKQKKQAVTTRIQVVSLLIDVLVSACFRVGSRPSERSWEPRVTRRTGVLISQLAHSNAARMTNNLAWRCKDPTAYDDSDRDT